MSPTRRGSHTPTVDQDPGVLVENGAERHVDEDLQLDNEDAGFECTLEELEGMDTWTKTLIAIKVLTAFKKRRKKRLEDEQKEKEKRERRKTLWRRLGFKLKIFNMFARKISSHNSSAEKIIKLKRKLGKPTFLLLIKITFVHQVILQLKVRKKPPDIRGR